jgi:hypothetical protein
VKTKMHIETVHPIQLAGYIERIATETTQFQALREHGVWMVSHVVPALVPVAPEKVLA